MRYGISKIDPTSCHEHSLNHRRPQPSSDNLIHITKLTCDLNKTQSEGDRQTQRTYETILMVCVVNVYFTTRASVYWIHEWPLLCCEWNSFDELQWVVLAYIYFTFKTPYDLSSCNVVKLYWHYKSFGQLTYFC